MIREFKTKANRKFEVEEDELDAIDKLIRHNPRVMAELQEASRSLKAEVSLVNQFRTSKRNCNINKRN